MTHEHPEQAIHGHLDHSHGDATHEHAHTAHEHEHTEHEHEHEHDGKTPTRTCTSVGSRGGTSTGTDPVG